MKTLRFALAVVLAVGTAAPSLAATFQYQAFLDGPSEDPPNASPGTGDALVDWDDLLHTMRVQATFADLIGTTTMAHIHAPTANPGTGTAGVATQTPSFTGFPLGVTSGSYDHTFDLTDTATYNSSFVTANGGTAAGAEAALKAALDEGKAYFNIHTNVFPGGEIRGFFTLVPEPGAGALLAAGLAALAMRRRR